jgi:hypothetical protein
MLATDRTPISRSRDEPGSRDQGQDCPSWQEHAGAVPIVSSGMILLVPLDLIGGCDSACILGQRRQRERASCCRVSGILPEQVTILPVKRDGFSECAPRRQRDCQREVCRAEVCGLQRGGCNLVLPSCRSLQDGGHCVQGTRPYEKGDAIGPRRM